MRPVSGLDRPWIQWTLVALGVLLIAVAAAAALALKRTRAEVVAARTAEMNARLDRRQLEIQLAHERATREALSMDPARFGSHQPPDAGPPTLTLTPLTRRGATPPPPSVDVPSPGRVIELRLVLPGKGASGLRDFSMALRTWAGGSVVWARGGLAPVRVDEGRAVTALITGDVLVPGAYELLLTAVGPTGQASEVATYEMSIGASKH